MLRLPFRPFPSTIEAQPRNVTFLTIKTVVKKIQKNDSQIWMLVRAGQMYPLGVV